MHKPEASQPQPEKRQIDIGEFPLGNQPFEFFLGKEPFEIAPTDPTDPSWHVDYVITRPQEFDADRNIGFKGLRDGESVLLGRMHEHGRFSLPTNVSREHVRITRDGSKVILEDLGSTNGTWVLDDSRSTSPTRETVSPLKPGTIGKSVTAKEVLRQNIQVAGSSEAAEYHPDRNEDAMFYDAESGAVGVFDGVGGATGSELASKVSAQKVSKAVKKIDSTLGRSEAHDAITDLLEQAHEEVIAQGVPGIATTGTLVKVFDNPSGSKYAVVGSVGDSRAYLIRDERVQHLTKDQAYFPAKNSEDALRLQVLLSEVTDVSELSDAEHQAFRRRNIITGCLGDPKNPPNIQISDFELVEGDRILITTDGIHDNLTTSEIENLVKQHPELKDSTAYLVNAAQQRSRDDEHIRAKADDMTAVMLRFE